MRWQQCSLPVACGVQDQHQYWREASNGLGTLPYFLGNTFVDMYYVLLAPMLFVGPYWNLTLPRTGVISYYWVAAAVVWWSSGVAYVFSALLPPGSTLVATVFLCLVVGAFISGLETTVASSRGTFMEWVLACSYSRCAADVWLHCIEQSAGQAV
jgi:ABC-2 type transporter